MKKDIFESFRKAGKKVLGDNFDGSYKTPPEFIFGGSKSENIENLIKTTNGGMIYHWDLKKGTLSRLTLNICDKADYQFRIGHIKWETIEEIVSEKRFDDSKLVEAIHRYHFTWCRIIKEFHDQKKEDRFYGSIRWNGTFEYSFIKNGDIFAKNLKQALYPCWFCVEKLEKLRGLPKRSFDREKFDIKEALKIPNKLPRNHQLDCEYLPNIYSGDWPKISKGMKRARDYTCEKCGDKYPPPDSGRLHCHHVNQLKHDNREINLQVLCKKCHKKKHSHMK